MRLMSILLAVDLSDHEARRRGTYDPLIQPSECPMSLGRKLNFRWRVFAQIVGHLLVLWLALLLLLLMAGTLLLFQIEIRVFCVQLIKSDHAFENDQDCCYSCTV